MKLALVGPEAETARYLAQEGGYSLVGEAEAERTVRLDEHLTASKSRTYAFLRENGFPAPAQFPEGSEPYIVRPDGDSGSRGIWVTEDFCEAGGAENCGFLVQEYLSGPVRCAQVTGAPGAYTVHPVLELTTDDRFIARSAVLAEDPELAETARKIAQALGLRGYLCVKAVDGRVVSLDDRLAGLPPRALYDLSGVNVLTAMLA